MANINDIKYRSAIQNTQIHKSLDNKNLNNTTKNNDFNTLLRKNLEEVKFSKHAEKRMEERGINIDNNTITKMNDAINKASLKGVRDMVVLCNEKAFIVNVPSKTVVTTMNGSEMKDNIFTNIDGAVII